MTINIKVYGPGCARCEQLGEKLRIALEEEEVAATVEKVTDPAQIAAAGILSLPGLEINGCMKCSGRVPEPAEIRYWLREATRTAGLADATESAAGTCGCEKGDAAHTVGTCSCGCSSSAPSACGCASTREGRAEGSCSCGSGGKRLLTFVVLILIAIACVRLIAKQVYGDAATVSRGNATPPTTAPAQTEEAEISTESPQTAKVTEVVYFLYGPRCVTCVNMEKWTRETVEAMQSQTSDLIFRVREAGAEDVRKYSLKTKGVVLREWRDGQELRSFNAMELWQSVRSGEQAYKSALRGLIDTFRNDN